MRVYKFLEAKYALDDIRKEHLKISEIADLNDPFELLACELSDSIVRLALTNTRSEMCPGYGLLCFSRSWDNALLWSHYADKHRGICLGFDIADDVIREVAYVSERARLPVDTQTMEISDQKKASDLINFTKFEGWRYEDEIRAWVRLDERQGNHYFIKFDNALILKQVILGPRCSQDPCEFEKEVAMHGNKVEVIKTRLAFKTFSVVRDFSYHSSNASLLLPPPFHPDRMA